MAFILLTAKRVSQQRNEPQETINHLLFISCIERGVSNALLLQGKS